jgi:hypothetical protein
MSGRPGYVFRETVGVALLLAAAALLAGLTVVEAPEPREAGEQTEPGTHTSWLCVVKWLGTAVLTLAGLYWFFSPDDASPDATGLPRRLTRCPHCGTRFYTKPSFRCSHCGGGLLPLVVRADRWRRAVRCVGVALVLTAAALFAHLCVTDARDNCDTARRLEEAAAGLLDRVRNPQIKRTGFSLAETRSDELDAARRERRCFEARSSLRCCLMWSGCGALAAVGLCLCLRPRRFRIESDAPDRVIRGAPRGRPRPPK